MTRIESKRGKAVLMAGHCAGMVDLVALPVWVGALIAHYKLDPQQAGGLATLFLAAAVASSLFFAPRFNRIGARWAATLGFAVAAFAFFALSRASSFGVMAALHVLGGLAAGCGLSFTHGTIGRSANPHRMFALVGLALGVFAVVFLGATPQIMAAVGGQALFVVFGGVMALAAVLSAWAFPAPDNALPSHHAESQPKAKIPAAAWYAMLGIGCMALTQAMMFSFVQRVGIDRGFEPGAVNGVLIALGIVNLFPAVLAAWLERRLSAHKVLLGGAVLQAVVAATIATSSTFAPYAVATAVFAAVMIFTHTFAFGLLARLDASGRAAAATPAMLMIGAAFGPIVGGTLVKAFGYGSLAVAAAVVCVFALVFFSRVGRAQALPAPQAQPQGAAR